MGGLLKTIWHSLRGLLRRPAFFAAAVVTLGLGIGANTAIFSVVNSVLLRQLPFRNAERAVWITSVRPHRSDAPFSLPDFLDYRDSIGSLDSISAFAFWTANMTGRGDAERFNGTRVSANLFATLGVEAAAGRTLEAEDDRPESPRVVVMTYGLWQRRFGGDASLIGKPLNLNAESYTLVGVLPPSFALPIPEAELAVPLVPDADPWRNDRNTVNFLRFIGRLRPGARLEGAQAEMNSLAVKLRAQFPEANARKLGVQLTPLREHITGAYRKAFFVLLAAVGFVLLIACANLANLNLVRASARRRELSILAALGASRWQIMKQLLRESMLLAAIGGVLGVLLAHWGVRGLLALSPANIPRAGEIRMDGRVLAFTALLSLAAAIATGLAPALSVSRGDLARQLSEGSRGNTGGDRGKMIRNGLVVVEVALSFVLLAGAGLLLRSFSQVQSVETGFDMHGVLTARLSLPAARYPRVEDVGRFYDALLPRLEALPGVSGAGETQMLPLSGMISSIPFTVAGRAFSREEIPQAEYRIVSPMYLRVMQIPLLAGREFREDENERTRLVCYVNQTMAKRFWRAGEALGAHLMLNDNNAGPREAEIVGVIGDVKDRGPESAPSFDIYIPMRQTHEDSVGLLRDLQYWALRTRGEPLALGDALREQVRRVDADVAASNVRSMEQYYKEVLEPRRFNLRLVATFAIAAVGLALAGIYGVVAYGVSQRANEIGVRMAIGAEPRRVLWMVIVDGSKAVMAGLAIGVVCVFGLTRALASLLFGASASASATLASVALLFAVVAFAALYLPARRATRIDCLTVLRGE